MPRGRGRSGLGGDRSSLRRSQYSAFGDVAVCRRHHLPSTTGQRYYSQSRIPFVCRPSIELQSCLARLLAAWRRDKRPIIHIRHDSTFPASAYRPGQDGNEFKDEVAPAAGETIIPKRTNSAFIGTGLERYLRQFGLETLVVTGVSTNNGIPCVVWLCGCRRSVFGALAHSDR